MTLSAELTRCSTIFIDTAPIIYYIEAHSQFGPLAKEVVYAFQSGIVIAYSSVITLVEVLPKPVETGNTPLADKFTAFLKYGKNITLLDVTADIAEYAGKLRGKYRSIRAMDAIQLAVAMQMGVDAFITNDVKLKSVTELHSIVLKDYII
ncbi:MAG: type II toxin-antitoxin system VapC family toxin [bacterium]|nr:type II toxin-antitoxin system VapC family toxin [bacterium]